jgi:hypothetical protein
VCLYAIPLIQRRDTRSLGHLLHSEHKRRRVQGRWRIGHKYIQRSESLIALLHTRVSRQLARCAPPSQTRRIPAALNARRGHDSRKASRALHHGSRSIFSGTPAGAKAQCPPAASPPPVAAPPDQSHAATPPTPASLAHPSRFCQTHHLPPRPTFHQYRPGSAPCRR